MGRFRPRKKIAAIYFNIPGKGCVTCEAISLEDNAYLEPAINAALTAFNLAYRENKRADAAKEKQS